MIISLDGEVSRINDPIVKEIVTDALSRAPAYFWTSPSSSTGKHHPPDEYRLGGLVLHTKRVCMIIEPIMKAIGGRSPIEQDIIRGACVLHDIGRFGLDKIPADHSLEDHPSIAVDHILTGPVFHRYHQGLGAIVIYNGLIGCIKSHMGQWGQHKVETSSQLCVHMADMIAAQRWCTVPVEE